MSNKPVLAVFLLATVGVAAGSAWAAGDAMQGASQHGAQNSVDPAHAAVMRDFGKLSADGAKGFQDLTLARVAIYDGKTEQAKSYADEAATAFDKTKSDDSTFIKAETELMTADQLSARKEGNKAGSKDASAKEAIAPATKDASASSAKVAWLPVDGAMSVDQDYTMSPAKTKAVSEANKSLAKGDRKGALDQLRLADVRTSVVLEVVPRDQTISDVHQAAQLIDTGKYYEGSQMLRKVQTAARYDITEVVGTTKAAASAGQPAGSQAAKPDAPATH